MLKNLIYKIEDDHLKNNLQVTASSISSNIEMLTKKYQLQDIPLKNASRLFSPYRKK